MKLKTTNLLTIRSFSLSNDMKRFLLFTFSLILTILVFPENKQFSRWSLSPEFGVTKFDGDGQQPLTSAFLSTSNNFGYGANLEYAITPIWGVSFDYFSLPFKGVYTNPLDTFSTKLNNYNVSATVNISRMIFPQTTSRLYINVSFGIGYADYKFDVKTVPKSAAPINPPYGNSLMVPMTLSVEYNITNTLGIGAKVRYLTSTRDNLEGIKSTQGATNDRLMMGSLFLRYKLAFKGKDHLRNAKMNEFTPDEGLELARVNSDRINKLDKELKKLDKKVDNQGRRIDSIARFLSNDGPDSDGDGVPDVRDNEPNTPPNTPVDFWGKTLKLNYSNISDDGHNGNVVPGKTGRGSKATNIKGKANTGADCNCCDEVPAVYFNFDRIDLDDNALIVISKIAEKMRADPSLYVEVRGYCDYVGKNPYNETLSKRRAERVKAEMVKVWKINAGHIIVNGKGKIIEPRVKYKPNRRCDFFFDRQ